MNCQEIEIQTKAQANLGKKMRIDQVISFPSLVVKPCKNSQIWPPPEHKVSGKSFLQAAGEALALRKVFLTLWLSALIRT